MNPSLLMLPLKNRWRLLRGSLRQGWLPLLSLFVIGGVLGNQLFFGGMPFEKGVPIGEAYVFYGLVLLAVVQFVRIFLSNTPIVKMHGATLHFLYNTPHFPKILGVKMLFSAIKMVSLAFGLTFYAYAFTIGVGFGWLFARLALYGFLGLVMAWIRYHGTRTACILLLVSFAIATYLLFWQTPWSVLFLVLLLAVLAVYMLQFLTLQIPKYESRLRMLDDIAAAHSQNNLAKMKQLVDENRSQKVRGVMLYHLPLQNNTVLMDKSLIGFVRMQKSLWVILVLLFLCGWVISHTSMLSMGPFLNTPTIRRALETICMASVFGALCQIFTHQTAQLTEKHKQGLFLPHSKGWILLSCSLLPALVFLVLTLFVGFIYAASATEIVLFWSFVMLLATIQGAAEAFGIKGRDLILYATNIALALGVYFMTQ